MTHIHSDVLIIGGGQAGLATAHQLQATDLSFSILERHTTIGASWANRYDALTLFTPRAFSALPGMDMDGDPQGYATRDEFVAYLKAYAEPFEAFIHLDEDVQHLERSDDYFYARTSRGNTYSSDFVIIATGPFQTPKRPQIANDFSENVCQFTAETYKNPDQIPSGTVLVVGDGATGRDIANELSRTHTVLLATGRARRLIPEKLLGQSIWWWLDKLRLLSVGTNTPLGRYMKRVDPFPARGRRLNSLKRRGVQIVPYLTSSNGLSAFFADGQVQSVTTVIWAIGYSDHSDWVAMPDVKDAHGNFVHTAGIAPVDKLYFVGRSWQRTRGSALVTGVGADARFIVDHILNHHLHATQSTARTKVHVTSPPPSR